MYGSFKIAEPQFRKYFKEDYFFWIRDEQRSDSITSVGSLLEDDLSEFLTSQLNIELVYVILEGICQTVKNPEGLLTKETILSRDCGSQAVMTITLDKIKIVDYKSWDVAQQQYFVANEVCPEENIVDQCFKDEAKVSDDLVIDKKVVI